MLAGLLGFIFLATPSPALSAQLTIPIEIHDYTLQEKANDIATEYVISTTTFSNLITSESNWNPEATSTTGDRGIMQISDYFHPEVSDKCAFDTDCAMRWAAGYIKAHGTDEWISCNCYLMAKVYRPDIPLTKDLKPNSPVRKGAIAIYNYHGIPHYAYVTGVQNDGTYGHWEKGSNLEPCKIYSRFVPESNPFLVGYWYEPVQDM